MQRRRLFEVSALFALTHCAASVTPERPLTDEERALTEAVLGYWYGLGGFVLVEGTQSPGADVLGQWWQLRFSRITERRLRMHWSGYLRDIEGSTPYDLLIVDGQIRADPDLQIRGFVADAPYEGHTFSGGLTLRDGVLDLDITSSRQYLPRETRQLERRRLFCRATRNRP